MSEQYFSHDLGNKIIGFFEPLTLAFFKKELK